MHEYINDNTLEKIDVGSVEESVNWAEDRHQRHSTRGPFNLIDRVQENIHQNG